MAYGYGYHERIYNNIDYINTLSSVGFMVNVRNISKQYIQNGLNPEEDLYLCKKLSMVLNKEQFDAFRMEIATFGNIPILSQYCGIGCVFCKVHTDSYLGHYPKIPPVDKEDLLRGFEYINPKVNYVRLGAGVLVAPHTDPFLHPNIYEFIKLASEHFPTKTITTVTTGAYIKEDKIDFLNSISNFGIDLSLITMQEQREKIIPRSERERTIHILKYAPLNKCTLMFTGNLDEIKKILNYYITLALINVSVKFWFVEWNTHPHHNNV